MEQYRLIYFRKKLEDMRNAEIKNAQKLKDGLRATLQDSVGELSLYDNHPADMGDAAFEREKDLGLILFTEDRLAMIAEGLDCIEKGTYGICQSCGGNISEERLEAIPYTNLCQQCKKENEGLERHIRPIEEDVIRPPFGGLDMHKEFLEDPETVDNNAFDGEDAWQAVARYGTSNSPSDIGSVDDYNDIYVNSSEDVGTVEDYESIASQKGKDGLLYENYKGEDDEDSPFNWTNE